MASFSRQWPLYVLMILPMVYFLTFRYLPMGGVVVAFKDYNMFKGIWASEWVGFDVFREIFSMPEFYRAVRNTLMLNVFSLLTFPVPIILALLLNELRIQWYKRLNQTLLYLPHFISWVIVGGLAIRLLATNTGSVNQFLKSLGLSPIPFLENELMWILTYTGAGVWHYAGWGSILYLAALTGINHELYEAAEVDGANRWQQTLHVTIPALYPITVVLATLSLGQILNAGFDQIFNLYNPLVYDKGDIIDTFVYRVGIISGQMGFGTAVGLFKSAIGFTLIVIAYRLAYKLANYRIF